MPRGEQRSRGPWFPGMPLINKLRGREVPRRDPSKHPIQFQPLYKIVEWQGDEHEECTDLCRPHDRVHAERRDNGFVWEGVYFPTLVDALQNQAFRRWYEDEGKVVVDAGRPVARPAQYGEDDDPPRPPFGFRLEEHFHEMTNAEILEYRRTGFVPPRLRRRGPDARPRRKKSTEISDLADENP